LAELGKGLEQLRLEELGARAEQVVRAAVVHAG
jgi:hypothetical protein